MPYTDKSITVSLSADARSETNKAKQKKKILTFS